MKKTDIENLEKYILCIIVFIFSLFLAYFVQTNEIFKGILALPAFGALVSILYELYKDNRAHERNIELQNKQQDFVLGTASHMAEVAYNKHVIFCEKYIDRIQKGRQELLGDGPSKKALNIGRELVIIRQEYSSWLTQEIEKSLKPFEQALIKMGAQEHYLEYSKLPVGEERTKVVGEIYKSFGLVLGHDDPLNEEDASIHIDKIIEKIRDILGINILTKLRLKATELALKRLDS